MVLFVIELKSRAVRVAGIRIDPDGPWMMQAARNLLDPVDGVLRKATHLIHDRDPLFTKAWRTLLKSGGVKCVPIPAQSPN
jgi:putative transposase